MFASGCAVAPGDQPCDADADCPGALVCDAGLTHESGRHACAEPDAVLSPMPPAKIDVILVIDNSNSMERVQSALQENLAALFSPLAEDGASLHVGVVTTDVDAAGNGNRGNLRSLAPIGAAGCAGDDAILAAPTGTDGLDDLIALIDVGVAGSGSEQGLAAAALALCKAQDDGAWAKLLARPQDDPARQFCSSVPEGERSCNRGLLRSDAALAILYLSDEGDASIQASDHPSAQWLAGCGASAVSPAPPRAFSAHFGLATCACSPARSSN